MDSKIKFVAFAAFASGIVCAMPTKQEIAGMHSLVAELMAPALSDYKANMKSAHIYSRTLSQSTPSIWGQTRWWGKK